MRLTVKKVGAVWCAQTLAKAETRQRINVFTRHAKGVIISTLTYCYIRSFGSTEECLKEFYCSVIGLITTSNKRLCKRISPQYRA